MRVSSDSPKYNKIRVKVARYSRFFSKLRYGILTEDRIIQQTTAKLET